MQVDYKLKYVACKVCSDVYRLFYRASLLLMERLTGKLIGEAYASMCEADSEESPALRVLLVLEVRIWVL